MLRSCAATERATHVRHSLETALCAEKRSHIPFAFIKTWRNNRKSLKKIIFKTTVLFDVETFDTTTMDSVI